MIRFLKYANFSHILIRPPTPPNSKFKIPSSPLCHTLWQTFKVCQSFSRTFPPKPHKSHTSHKSQKSHQFKILLSEPSAKDERRMSEGLAKDNALPQVPTVPHLPQVPKVLQVPSIHNSKFKIQNFPSIQNSKFSQFKILLKALIIKHYFVPLPPAKPVIVFGTIYAILLWQALCPKESAAQVIFIKHTF